MWQDLSKDRYLPETRKNVWWVKIFDYEKKLNSNFNFWQQKGAWVFPKRESFKVARQESLLKEDGS